MPISATARRMFVPGSRIALLAATLLGGAVTAANAQYRYVPSPDYYRNDTVEGTVVGGAFGALTGAILGGKKDRGEGALIGAGVGAVAGNLVGRSKDRADEHQAAMGSAAVNQANRRVSAQAVTNHDLIRLTQAGLSEDVIISAVRSRGARLDLSPTGLITLKENGVSDRVLIAAQELTNHYAAPATRVITQPSTVIVTPARRYPYHYHHRPRYHPTPRARVHYHFRF